MQRKQMPFPRNLPQSTQSTEASVLPQSTEAPAAWPLNRWPSGSSAVSSQPTFAKQVSCEPLFCALHGHSRASLLSFFFDSKSLWPIPAAHTLHRSVVVLCDLMDLHGQLIEPHHRSICLSCSCTKCTCAGIQNTCARCLRKAFACKPCPGYNVYKHVCMCATL
jgi:hypothetical protein